MIKHQRIREFKNCLGYESVFTSLQRINVGEKQTISLFYSSLLYIFSFPWTLNKFMTRCFCEKFFLCDLCVVNHLRCSMNWRQPRDYIYIRIYLSILWRSKDLYMYSPHVIRSPFEIIDCSPTSTIKIFFRKIFYLSITQIYEKHNHSFITKNGSSVVFINYLKIIYEL